MPLAGTAAGVLVLVSTFTPYVSTLLIALQGQFTCSELHQVLQSRTDFKGLELDVSDSIPQKPLLKKTVPLFGVSSQ